jgi:ribosomal RNA methyltransferase Nop2
MGVGRRMKKQGPPEALSEEHFAKLKRKAGLPVDVPTEATAEAPKKKRKTAKETAPSKSNGAAAAAAPKKSALKSSNGVKPAKEVPQATNGKTKGKKAAKPLFDDMSDDEVGLGDEFGDSDLEGGSSGEDGPTLGDDFLGSDDDDDSVVDSDDGYSGGKRKPMWSDDEDESDVEEKLTAANIVGLSRKLDQQMEDESAMQTNIHGDKPKVLADEDDDDDELAAKTNALLAPDLQLLRTRITETIRVLDDFANLHQEGRSRAEYTAQLLKDICAYYGYSEYLAEKLYNLFTPREAFAFFEANESARPVVIRTNTLRTNRRELAQALINRGVTLEPVGKWSKVGLQIFETSVPLGATPEYLAGHYILQAASSFLPCMALDPQMNERGAGYGRCPRW